MTELNGAQRAFRNLSRATVGLYLILALLLGLSMYDRTVQVRRVKEVAAVTTSALCSLRGDLERRVADGEQFLEDNPNGIPGLPSKTIQTSIDNQKETIDALSIIDC